MKPMFTQSIVFEGDPIICAVCNKPIDSYNTWFDMFEECHHIELFCHGEVEIHKLTVEWLMENISKIRSGEVKMITNQAFADQAKRLPNPNSLCDNGSE